MDITVPTNFPAGDRRTSLVLLDREGDMWRQAGMTRTGEPLMVCDLPQDAEERGTVEGGHEWRRSEVEARFGPVRTLGGAA